MTKINIGESGEKEYDHSGECEILLIAWHLLRHLIIDFPLAWILLLFATFSNALLLLSSALIWISVFGGH
jgi:hypothetical protein